MSMERRIFTYWHQGFSNAPAVVNTCVQSLKAHHPEWEIVLLDDENVHEWIEPIPISKAKWETLRLAHQSDVIRTQLLVRYGGVWADPTIFFTKSMDTWLPERMEPGLFLFHRPGPDRLIANWFIAATKGNLLLQRLYDELCKYWENNDFINLVRAKPKVAIVFSRIINRNLTLPRLWLRKPVLKLLRTAPYMIYHYMFYDLVCRDSRCNEAWSRVEKVRPDGKFLLKRHGLHNEITPDLKARIDSGSDHLYKLAWKLPPEFDPNGTVLEYLDEVANTRPA